MEKKFKFILYLRKYSKHFFKFKIKELNNAKYVYLKNFIFKTKNKKIK